MAVLTAAQRKAAPHLGPHGSFPVPDREHLEKAIQLAPRSFHAGNISRSQMLSIQSRARKRLGKTAAESMAK